MRLIDDITNNRIRIEVGSFVVCHAHSGFLEMCIQIGAIAQPGYIICLVNTLPLLS